MSEDRTLLTDDALVAGYLRGNLEAFDELYDRYRNRLYAYVLRNVGDRYSDEVFQDVWVRVLVGVRRYRADGRFRSWLFTCAHNVIVDHYRKRGSDREQPLDGLEADAPRSTDDDLVTLVESALWSLPPEQRQAFFLREELECSLREISEIQGCTLEAAKSRLRYACAKLREILTEMQHAEP